MSLPPGGSFWERTALVRPLLAISAHLHHISTHPGRNPLCESSRLSVASWLLAASMLGPAHLTG